MSENQKAQHTPGPWKVGSRDERDYLGSMNPYSLYYIEASNHEVIAELDSCGVEHMPHLAANARLIAAAPELLAMLKRALAGLELAGSSGGTVEAIRAAIAKAEGRA